MAKQHMMPWEHMATSHVPCRNNNASNESRRLKRNCFAEDYPKQGGTAASDLPAPGYVVNAQQVVRECTDRGSTRSALRS